MRTAIQRLRVRPWLWRGLIAMVVGAGAGLAVARPTASLTIGWDIGVAVCLAELWTRMAVADSVTIRRRARDLEEGRWWIFVLTVGAANASLLAIFVDLVATRGEPGIGLRATLAGITVLLSWAFVHTVFAQHYAHLWFESGGGIDFPGEDSPDYRDFLYFSFVIGMTFQVSDVATKSSMMRGLVLAHGLVSFVFNTIILALSVNLAAGLA